MSKPKNKLTIEIYFNNEPTPRSIKTFLIDSEVEITATVKTLDKVIRK